MVWYRGDGLRWRELHQPRRVERWNITIGGSTVGFATLTESCVGLPPSQGCSESLAWRMRIPLTARRRSCVSLEYRSVAASLTVPTLFYFYFFIKSLCSWFLVHRCPPSPDSGALVASRALIARTNYASSAVVHLHVTPKPCPLPAAVQVNRLT